MSDKTNTAQENYNVDTLLERVTELESALQVAKQREQAAYGVANDFLERNSAIAKENSELKARNKQLEDPDSIEESGIGWLSKIVLVLRRVGRPMRAKQIIAELREIDKRTKLLQHIWNPDSYMSVVLSKGAKDGRLKLFSIKGTRGGYYALDEWLDKDGQLPTEMKQKLV